MSTEKQQTTEEFTAAAPPDPEAPGTGETSFADAEAPPASERAAADEEVVDAEVVDEQK